MKILNWIIIFFGVVLRLTQYAYNRSFRLDEIILNTHILKNNLITLIKPIETQAIEPVAAPLFLVFQKCFSQYVSDCEYAFRFISLVAGISSIIVFHKLCDRRLSSFAHSVALAIFCFSGPLIFYASDSKPYSLDVLIALLLLLLSQKVVESKSFFYGTCLLFMGLLSLVTSIPASFTLCSVVVYLFVKAIKNQVKKSVVFILLVIYLSGFFFVYFNFYDQVSHNRNFQHFWQDYFFPLTASLKHQCHWIMMKGSRFLDMSLGLAAQELAALMLLIGCGVYFQRKKQVLWLYVLPLIFAFIASSVQIYPFRARLLLFATPGIIILVAIGLDRIYHLIVPQSKKIAFMFVFFLFVLSVGKSSQSLFKARSTEEFRPLLEFVHEQSQAGDALYLMYGLKEYHTYYAPKLGLNESRIPVIEGPPSPYDWRQHQEAIDSLKQFNRVWLITRPRLIRGFYTHYFSSHYHRKKKVDGVGLTLYLYEKFPGNHEMEIPRLRSE